MASSSPCQQMNQSRRPRKRNSCEQMQETLPCELWSGPSIIVNPPLVKEVPNRSAYRRSNMIDFLDDFLHHGNKHRKTSSSSTSSSSSSSSSSHTSVCNVDDFDCILPTTACEEEAIPSVSATIKNQSTQSTWNPQFIFENGRVELAEVEGTLLHWDLNNDVHMFAFQGSTGHFYVQAPETAGSYLTLTAGEGLPTPDALSQSDAKYSDARCFTYLYDAGVDGLVLRPAKNSNLAVGESEGKYAALKTMADAAKWSVDDK